MIKANIIKPEKASEEISCDDCKIKYSSEDYSTLFKSKKIIYSDIRVPGTTYVLCLCHDCLFKYVKHASGGKETKLIMLDDGKEFHFKFDPDDLNK